MGGDGFFLWMGDDMLLTSVNSTRSDPVLEPVSVAELQAHSKIDDPENQSNLESLVTAARQAIEEGHLWRVTVNQTCIDKFGWFSSQMELRWSPVQSITSVQYVDTDGVTQTLSTDIYELGEISGIGVVRLKDSQSWPSIQSHEDTVTITYVAGYGSSPDDVPLPIRQAILIYANWLYVAREGEGGPFETLNALLQPYSAHREI